MLVRDEIKAAIEAILFVRAEQIELDDLAEMLDLSPEDIKEIQ